VNFAIEHIGLPAQNTTALKDWYVQVLRSEVIYTNDQSPPMFLLRVGGAMMIEIYAGDQSLRETGNNRLNGWRHVALRVESIEEARTHLESAGVPITDEIRPAGGGGRVLFFADPEGNLLHLVERSTDSPVR